jgi:LPS O-antigen subunit length determinant protein (WzzB/FepE family)
MESQFYNVNLLQVFLKWKIHLFAILLLAFIASVIFSGERFIKPKYKSVAIVYPSNISPYSDESQSEQSLEIFNSFDIRDSVIRKLNLGAHYKFNKQDKLYNTHLYDEYSTNVTIKKTPNDAIQISALDINPDTAVLIINNIISFFNKKVERMHRAKFKEVFDLHAKQLNDKLSLLDSLKKRYELLSTEYELLDYGSQSRELTRGILKSSGVDTKTISRLKKNMEEKGGELLLLKSLIDSESEVYAEIRLNYDIAKKDYERQFTHLSILSSPYAADKKSYPIRWLIVVLSLLGSFFFSFIIILIIENSKNLKQD